MYGYDLVQVMNSHSSLLVLAASRGLYLLVMVVQLANFGGYLADLPAFQAVASIQNCAVLLLEFPQLCVNVECAAKVCLPLLVTVLW